MYVAVLAASAILVLTTATGSSADASCTASLPALVKGAKCISALLQGLIHCILPGHLLDTQLTPAQSLQNKSQTSPQETTGSSTPHSHQCKCSVKWVKCFHLLSMSLEAG